MESALHARDHIGVQDFVLLENYTSVDAFIENLRKRFKANLIYVSPQLVMGYGVPYVSMQFIAQLQIHSSVHCEQLHFFNCCM